MSEHKRVKALVKRCRLIVETCADPTMRGSIDRLTAEQLAHDVLAIFDGEKGLCAEFGHKFTVPTEYHDEGVPIFACARCGHHDV